jgi:pimeloyl-ACP methyl ester carboxylesterase
VKVIRSSSAIPETRYAKSGTVNIAYAMAGEGPFDTVLVPGFVSHVELGWDVPFHGPFRRWLASFSRVIVFDKRGTGMSDPVAGAPPLETRMDDLRAVLDAVASPRAAVIGVSEGVPMSVLFAATYPERTAALVLIGGFARMLWAPDYPWGYSEQRHQEEVEADLTLFGPREKAFEYVAQAFGEEGALLADYWRQSASPGVIEALAEMNKDTDVRDVLPTIRVPTLVIHGEHDHLFPIEGARYIADRVPGARLVELPGSRHVPFGKTFDQACDEVERFLSAVWETGGWLEPKPDSVLATVLFTDLVGSTARAAELGDRAWRELLERHNDAVRRQLVRFNGREVDSAGDGFFATFAGPARAIRCACAVTEAVAEIGLEVRAGIHTGECELLGDKPAGIAISIGARVAARAAPGEVLVSQTVKDLVAGSGLAFEDRGLVELRGVPGQWSLYAVTR